MAQATITWTPAGGTNSLSQLVQYKQSSSSTWLTFSTLLPGAATETITGLNLNTIYDFMVVDNCAVGGLVASGIDEKIKFSCPTLTVTPTFNSVTVAFTGVGANITKYTLQLLDSTGNSVIATQDITNVTPTSFTNTFSSLSASTVYNVRLTMYAGSTFAYSNICSLTSFTTGATPVCLPPVAVSATMS